MSDEAKAGYVKAADGHVYHKSSSANATIAPTNKFTLDNVIKDGHLGSEGLEFVTLVHFEWGVRGAVDFDQLKADYGFTSEDLEHFFNQEAIIKALEERSVPIRKVLTNTGLVPVGSAPAFQAKVTPTQLIIANVIMDMADTRPLHKKLKDHGVSTATYQMWLRDKSFTDYLRDRAESLIGDQQHEAMMALMDRVQAGDVKAIQYYHELIGRHVKKQPEPTSVTVNTSNGQVSDLQRIIIDIIEIIVDEVDDQNTALRISDRLKGLITGNQVAGVLAKPEIIKPEIAEARVITPELQAAMNKGLGA